MKNNGWLVGALSTLVAAGFLLPFWPLCALGIALGSVLRHPLFALCAGFLLDLAWGAPGGAVGAFPFPFVALAFLSFVGRSLADRYFFPKSTGAVY